ncbi:MAG TPA: GYF domain-containing protein [Polyangiaceae bacterium]
MKFLCPSCKAKYQIADEKVAGRSVKMKCRKCGHLIHVSSVAGVGDALPGSLAPPPGDSAAGAQVGSAPPVEAAPPPAALPKTAARAAVPKVGAPKPTASKGVLPAPTPPPRTVGPARVAPAVGGVGKSGAAFAKATAPAPKIATKPEIKPQQNPVLLNDALEEEEATRIADVSALAGAFSLAVGSTQDAQVPDALSMPPGEEWYVGINGVPVGPIKLSELRAKAGSGAVTRESLVWREGFEDWRPLKTFPELSAIVDESISSVRASLTPFTPGSVVTDPFAPGARAASAPAGSPIAGAAVVADDLEAAGLQPRRSSSAAWIAVVVALMFGLTIGFVMFGRQKSTETVIKYVEVPASAAANSGSGDDKGTANAIDESTIAGDTKNNGKKSGTAAPKGSADGQGLTGLKGLSGLSGLGPRGPDVGGPSNTPVGGGGQLDAGQIQQTVARYTGSVKRACWQPALDARDKDAPTTARVNVQITISPSGSVSGASAGSDPRGYRGLSQCISTKVRAWSFPPSGDSTTVNVPFVFAAQ